MVRRLGPPHSGEQKRVPLIVIGPKPNKYVTRGNKEVMGSKVRELKEFSDHTFHPLGFQRHSGKLFVASA
jgi:hypothetical protein